MAREILDSLLRQEVAAKYDNRCYICGYSLKPALRSHHVIPVSLGGEDTPENLVLLCANCHSLTHFYSSKRHRDSDISRYASAELTSEASARLKELTEKIHKARQEVERNKGITRNAYGLDEAINVVAQKNGYTSQQRELVTRLVHLVIDNIPKPVVEGCSFRLLKSGKYISINMMNYLLFRTPAYGDLGGDPYYDCYIIFPDSINEVQFIENIERRVVFRFAHFDCVNLGLSVIEALSFEENHWQLFRQACETAMNARRTRDWVSNIRV